MNKSKVKRLKWNLDKLRGSVLHLLWGPPYVWEERASRHYTLKVPNNFLVLSTSLNSLHPVCMVKFDYSTPIVGDHIVIKNFFFYNNESLFYFVFYISSIISDQLKFGN